MMKKKKNADVVETEAAEAVTEETKHPRTKAGDRNGRGYREKGGRGSCGD